MVYLPPPAPQTRAAPFVDLPLVWRPQGPMVVVQVGNDVDTAPDICRPGLLHVVDGHFYRLECYVYPNTNAMKKPCHYGILATAARFYLEVGQ